MPRTRFVFFDLGNVLVTFDHEIAVTQLAELALRTPDLVRAAVFESDLQTRYETGLISADDFTIEVNQRLQTSLAKSDILEAISAIFRPNEPILAALEKLRDAEIPMGVLSNTCDAHWQWLSQRGWPMLDRDWFETTILSYEVKSMKPDAGIYAASEVQAQCSGSQVFFTDDRADNIAAASLRGWETYQYGTIEGLLSKLDVWLARTHP